jgi:TolB-like protein
MGRIFLSYAREDRAFAECVARLLEGAGHSVWWDRHIDSGEEFSAEIEAELDKSDVVLVAWSQVSVKSRWVRDEAAVGGDSGRLVPVSLDGSLPPMGFRQFHTQDLSGWNGSKRDERTGQLLHSVERRLKEGAKETPAAPLKLSRRPRSPAAKRPLAIAAAMLALLLAAGTALFLVRGQDRAQGPLTSPTIALLPFTATPSDPQLRDIAAQARDSMSHTLPQRGIRVRLLSSLPPNLRSAGDFLLSGEVTRNTDKVVATVRLDEAAHGVTVYSRRFEAGPGDIQNLAERIGVQIASFFDAPNLLILDRRHPLDPALIAELLADADDPLQRLQISKRVAAKAPSDPNAQIGIAFFTGFALDELPPSERPQAVMAARRAAERALALAPGFGDTYATWCLLHSDARLAECEDQLRTGYQVDPDVPYLNGFLARQVAAVGRFEEAAALTRLSYTHDPSNDFKIRDMLRELEFAGEADDARNLYQKGARWWPEAKVSFFRNRMWGLLFRGDFVGISRLEQEVGTDALPPAYRKSAPIADAVRSKSAPALHRICADAREFTLMVRCMIASATIDDENEAYAMADRLYPRRVGRTPAETERIWLNDPDGPPLDFISAPATAQMRRDPRYIAIAQRTGLLDYWRSGRPPDFCRGQAEPVCSELLGRR